MGLLFIACERMKAASTYANDLGYQCFADDPGRIRKPDGSLIRKERLTKLPEDVGYMPIPADLVIEVVSPNDLAYEVAAKVREYLTAGFPLIWVIYPNVREVIVHSRGQSPRMLGEGDEITIEPALAEFRCKVSAFFE
jgi:Uma2 family endonuclease